MSKNLYIPLEIYRRELNGMLLLSVVAASKGWKVVVGGKKVILPNLANFPEGAVLLKSIVPGEIGLQKSIIDMGHKVTSIDAEGLLPSNGESGVKIRYSSKSISLSETLCFWGPEQYEQVQGVFSNIESVGAITGSPIFDYWRYLKFENKKNTPANRKRVLIATSFPYPNHFIDRQMSYQSVRDASGKEATEDHINEIFLDGKLQDFVYPRFKEFVIKLIKKSPDIDFLLRPHPAENPKPWKDLAEKFSNVQLSLSGEISPLLLENDALVHFNSTTSIEAAFYEKAVVTFVPEGLAPELSGRMNRHALAASQVESTIESAIDAVRKITEQKSFESKLDLDTIIKDSGSSRIAKSCENIIDELEKVKLSAVSRSFPSKFKLMFNWSVMKTKVKLRIIWIVGWVDHLTGIFKGKYAPSINYYKYGKSKQGHLDMRSVREKAKTMVDTLNLGDKNIKFKILKDGLFVVEKQNG